MESTLRVEGINPYYKGLRIVDCDDFFPQSFGKVELDAIYYSLIRSDSAMELITEWPTFEEINDFYNPGAEDIDGNLIFEAITVDKFNRTEKRMLAVVRTFNKHLKDSEITALPPVVGNPRRSGAFAYVTVQLPFSDGQVVSVIFHSPEGDRKRIAPDDTIIAFLWLLNKRDITHVVAPEEGREVSLETIAKRLTQLVVKNSARFEKQQKAAMEERKALDEAREALRAAEDRQVELMDGVGAAVKEVETYEARLSATLTALEKQRTINAELQAKIDALRAQQKQNAEGERKGQETSETESQPRTSLDSTGIEEKDNEAPSDAEAGDAATPAEPEYLESVRGILAGKYDADTAKIIELLEKIIESAEQSGTFEQYESLINDASNHLTELLTKEAA